MHENFVQKIGIEFGQFKKRDNFAPANGKEMMQRDASKESANAARRSIQSSWHSHQSIALWCNGSTSDSGSACEGSNPSKAT